MPVHRSKSVKHESAKPLRRDPYEVLGVSRNSTDQDIKSAYRKLALKYHPDKNANDPIAADIFKEATFSYKILSDSDKRRQYDTAGFEAVESESQEFEVDLSSLGAVNTMFAALFSKIGVPIKTTVSTTILEEALNGMVTICPLALGQPRHRKVERQCAHFYSISITEEQARSGYVCQVQSPDKSKFKVGVVFTQFVPFAWRYLTAFLMTCSTTKVEPTLGFRYVQLLYFDQEENGGLSLALQEDSAKKGNITSAGMYFLCFPTYRLDQAAISMATTKDTDMAFFKKLDGFRPCEITELKAGTHVFAVYGDNFFRSASYQIEALCAAPFVEEKESLRAVEAQILSKKVELSNFETEYEEVLKHFTEMTSRYAQEMQAIDMLLKQRNEIKASYRVVPVIKSSSRSKKYKEAKDEGQLRGLRLRRTGSKSKNRSSSQEAKEDGQLRDESTTRDKPRKKKWYKIRLKVHKR